MEKKYLQGLCLLCVGIEGFVIAGAALALGGTAAICITLMLGCVICGALGALFMTESK